MSSLLDYNNMRVKDDTMVFLVWCVFFFFWQKLRSGQTLAPFQSLFFPLMGDCPNFSEWSELDALLQASNYL